MSESRPGGRRDTPRAIAEKADGSHRFDENDTDIVTALRTVAARRTRPPAQVALAWLLGKAAVSAPIVGVTKPHQLHDALAAVDLPLSDDDIATLEAPVPPPRTLRLLTAHYTTHPVTARLRCMGGGC